MSKIKILDESVSNIIAAGEVVENPASMIKEMVENSLDASATMIRVEVFNGGLDVKISDNGVGMDKEDTLLSIERHATSKISTKDDIFNLHTYGFRGEALASIASVSKLTIATRPENSQIGYKIGSYGGVVRKFEETSRNVGTDIEVRDLFYNTPARKKFLRKESTEYTKIRDIILKEALVNSDVAFALSFDGKESIKTSGKGIENAILELFGKNVLKGLKKFEYGYLGTIDLLRSTKDYIFTYVNKRYVKSNTIERAVVDGYYTKLMKGKYPFAIVFMDIDPREIDVNVHPSKKIIKFSNEKMAYSMIKNPIDEFFYTEERESWQPNVDLLKQNVNVENPDEKIKDLFTGEMIKGETPKFFSFETHDGKNGSKTLEPFEVKEELARPVNRVDEINEIIKQMTKELEVEESKTDQQVYKKGTFEYGTENINTSENSVTSVGKEYKILGQLFNMYILVSEGETLQIYDQHIIHERILYEELKDKFYAKKMDSQQLLVPQKMEINQVDKGILLENIAVFQEFGFDIDEFSENEIIFRAVPTFDFRDTIENVFKKLLEDLKKDLEIKDLRERIIISMSCKGAIKAGQKLEMHEMERMVKRLHEVGKYTCPHGRPIIVNITKDDLDKMFGRKK